MIIPFHTVMRLTRDEGRAAVLLGLPETVCPYKIGEHSREIELRGYWLSGYVEQAAPAILPPHY